MKSAGAVLLTVLAVAPLAAQNKSVGGFGSVTFPGLGHAPAGGNPWGNVLFPAMPQGSNGFAAGNGSNNRYGGLVPGFRSYNGVGQGGRRNRSTGIYAFPVYVGGYGYGYAPSDQPQQSDAPQDTAAPQQQPVVINQYFGVQPPERQPSPEDAANSNFHFYQAPTDNDSAPASTSGSYYLIAFKDHSIYSAVAYYTDGDTLHYFTEGNVHNQASLALVDRPLTEQLNRQRNVDVRLP